MAKRIAKLAIVWIIFICATIFLIASAIVLQNETAK